MRTVDITPVALCETFSSSTRVWTTRRRRRPACATLPRPRTKRRRANRRSVGVDWQAIDGRPLQLVDLTVAVECRQRRGARTDRRDRPLILGVMRLIVGPPRVRHVIIIIKTTITIKLQLVV